MSHPGALLVDIGDRKGNEDERHHGDEHEKSTLAPWHLVDSLNNPLAPVTQS